MFFNFVLSVFSNQLSNVGALTGANSVTNDAFAAKSGFFDLLDAPSTGSRWK